MMIAPRPRVAGDPPRDGLDHGRMGDHVLPVAGAGKSLVVLLDPVRLERRRGRPGRMKRRRQPSASKRRLRVWHGIGVAVVVDADHCRDTIGRRFAAVKRRCSRGRRGRNHVRPRRSRPVGKGVVSRGSRRLRVGTCRCGLRSLGSLGLERRDAETNETPEPDTTLRAFEKDVEGCVHHEREPEGEHPEVHTRPPFAPLATCSKECDYERDANVDCRRTQTRALVRRHARARSSGCCADFDSGAHHRPLIVVVVGEVDAESLAGPEVRAVYGVVDDVLPPAETPRARALEVARVGRPPTMLRRFSVI